MLKITHVGVLVPSIDEALPTWTTQYGLTLIKRLEVPQEGVRTAFLSPDRRRQSFMVELVEPTSPDDMSNPVSRRLRDHGGGVLHLAMVDPDLDAAKARLNQTGAVFAEREALTPVGGSRLIVSPNANNGVMVEILPGAEWEYVWEKQDDGLSESAPAG